MSDATAIVVVGPTCSGKSALAMLLAERLGGVVVNADAMQCYRDLRVLTARPSAADEARVPHALYGVRDGAMAATAAWWRDAALEAMQAARQAGGRVPILCGGTGMYLGALVNGLAAIPYAGEAARQEARALLASEGAAALHGRLATVDPVTAGRLRPSDGQRLARAWEVWRGTGRGVAAWQADARPVVLPWRLRVVTLLPDRAGLRAAIAARWQVMLERGAVAEAAALRARALDPALPVLRAHGVPELSAHLDGGIDLAEAGRRAVLAIGQYTKRQATWLKHHNLVDPKQNFTINASWNDLKQENLKNMAAMVDFLSSRD